MDRTARIFLVDDLDDAPKVREELQDTLNANVVLRTTVKSACAELEARGPTFFDLILSDYDLPDGIGLSILEKAREEAATAHLVLFSGEETAKTKQIGPDVMNSLQELGGEFCARKRLQAWILSWWETWRTVCPLTDDGQCICGDENLKALGIPENDFCYLSMPYGKEYEPDLKKAFIKKFFKNIEPSREVITTDEAPTQDVFANIKQAIMRADAMIVDLTALRPSVLMEIGMAQALNRRTLVLCPSDSIKDIPFNLQITKVVEFDPDSWEDDWRLEITKWWKGLNSN